LTAFVVAGQRRTLYSFQTLVLISEHLSRVGAAQKVSMLTAADLVVTLVTAHRH
jgi:hypothetical protein